MSEVFLVCGRGLGGFSKLAVLKVLRPNMAEDADFVDMFLGEARLAAQIRIIRKISYRPNEIGQDGNTYFLAMEYLQGQTLQKLLHRARKRDGIAMPILVEIFSQALAGLHAALTAKDFSGQPLGIVHRDVSPQNIIVTYDGQVKLVDFGIARASERSRHTQAGIIKGKVRYMPPEQAMGRELDSRADIFSAGVVLWEALAGTRMWADENDNTVLYKLIQKSAPRSPRSVNPLVPERLARICERALAPDPENRFPTARDMQFELERYGDDSGNHASNEEIGNLMGTYFETERSEMGKTVEAQVVALGNMDTGQIKLRAIPEVEVSSISSSLMGDAMRRHRGRAHARYGEVATPWDHRGRRVGERGARDGGGGARPRGCSARRSGGPGDVRGSHSHRD